MLQTFTKPIQFISKPLALQSAKFCTLSFLGQSKQHKYQPLARAYISSAFLHGL